MGRRFDPDRAHTRNFYTSEGRLSLNSGLAAKIRDHLEATFTPFRCLTR